MRKSLAILSALVISASAAAAHADTISGAFSAVGSTTFTSSQVDFQSAFVLGDIEGFFAPYLYQGDAITFPAGTYLPYANGTNTPPASVYPSGYVPIFSVTGNGETYTFEMNEYTANYVANNPSVFSGCNMGSTCLDITGMGYFLESGVYSGTTGAATFTFSSQYVAGQANPITSFSASTAAAASPVPTNVAPEPSSLALLGTGLLGVVGVARRKFSV